MLSRMIGRIVKKNTHISYTNILAFVGVNSDCINKRIIFKKQYDLTYCKSKDVFSFFYQRIIGWLSVL